MKIEALIPLILFLIFVFVLGIWSSRNVGKKSQSFLLEYFLGNRELGGFLLAMTMVATYGSASSFLGGPGAAYREGLGWVLLSMTQVVTGYFVLLVLGKKFAIMSRKYEAVTLIDFLKKRYESNKVVIFSAISIIIFLFSSMTAQWVGGAYLIQSLTNLSYASSLFIFAVTVLVYVIVGGFRAVAVTDALQGIVMFFGTSIILIGTIVAGGGISNIMNDLISINPNLVTPFGHEGNLTPAYVSSYWILVGIGVVALPQIAVRAMSYKDAKSMHRALIISTVVVGFIMLGMHLTGVFARVILPNVEVVDQVMPLVTLEVLPPWLAGVVLAAPLAAIMSTVDSLLLLVSSAVVKDVYINYIKPTASHKQIKRASYVVTSVIGILVCIFALSPPDLLIMLNLFAFGGLEAAFIWPLIFGLYWRAGNKYGALTSMVVGVISYIIIQSFWPDPFGMHSVILPIVFSFFSYIIATLLMKNKSGNTGNITSY